MKKTEKLIERVNQFLDNVQKNGFRGVKVQRIEKESIWHPEYAIFILEFQIPLTGMFFERESDSDYAKKAWFDEDQLKKDIENHIKQNFRDCDVQVHYEGREFEIIGQNYQAFYDHYQDQLEEKHMKDDYTPGQVWTPEDYN